MADPFNKLLLNSDWKRDGTGVIPVLFFILLSSTQASLVGSTAAPLRGSFACPLAVSSITKSLL